MRATFNPDIFAAGSLEAAKKIILTTEAPDAVAEWRWQAETPYLADLIIDRLHLHCDYTLLDYGCGIGRLAKQLIERCGCSVVGVDTSESMRALSAGYVSSDRFVVCAPEMLVQLAHRGLRLNGAIAVWVLQHCLTPGEDVALIQFCLERNGELFVVNNKTRALPTREYGGWIDDGMDVKEIVSRKFTHIREGQLDPVHVSQTVSNFSFWAQYRLFDATPPA